MTQPAGGEIAFLDDPSVLGQAGEAILARIPRVASKEALIDEVARQLAFPPPFGRNWDALLDMLERLEWVTARSVVIIHDAVPALSRSDLEKYLSILRDANAFWRSDGGHHIMGVFPTSAHEDLMG